MSRTSTKMSVFCKGNVLVYYPPFHLMFYLEVGSAVSPRLPRGSAMTYTRPPTGFLCSWPRGTYCYIIYRLWSTPTSNWVLSRTPLVASFQPSPTWCPRNDRTSHSPLRRSGSTFSPRSHPCSPKALSLDLHVQTFSRPSRHEPHAQPPPASPPAACNERMQARGSQPCIHLYLPSCVPE